MKKEWMIYEAKHDDLFIFLFNMYKQIVLFYKKDAEIKLVTFLFDLFCNYFMTHI